MRLRAIVNTILDADLPYLTGIDYSKIDKIRQLLYIISQSVPFKPNMVKLAERTGIARNTLKNYLHYLEDAGLIHLLYSDASGIGKLTKPEKIYISNPNTMMALGTSPADPGNLRETFFINQVSVMHSLHYPSRGVFLVDGKYLFEIGGKSKSRSQIKGISDAFLAVDNIETGMAGQIPLWLFGFLY
jgi:predicted AAA+ superfamily ATPase